MLFAELLRFSDNGRSYDDRGVFVIAEAASLCGPSPICVWLPHAHNFPGQRQSNSRISYQVPSIHCLLRPHLCTKSLLGFSERRTYERTSRLGRIIAHPEDGACCRPVDRAALVDYEYACIVCFLTTLDLMAVGHDSLRSSCLLSKLTLDGNRTCPV